MSRRITVWSLTLDVVCGSAYVGAPALNISMRAFQALPFGTPQPDAAGFGADVATGVPASGVGGGVGVVLTTCVVVGTIVSVAAHPEVVLRGFWWPWLLAGVVRRR